MSSFASNEINARITIDSEIYTNNNPSGISNNFPFATDNDVSSTVISTRQLSIDVPNIIEFTGDTEASDDDSKEYDDIETELQTADKNPYRLHAQLSAHKAYHAREAIIDFFENNLRMVWLGNSSSDMRGHYLYRGRDGNLYNVHRAYGGTSIFYFTEEDLNWAFEENPEGKPNWTLPDEAKKEIARMNGENLDDTEEELPSLVEDSESEDDIPMPLRAVSDAIPIPMSLARGISNT